MPRRASYSLPVVQSLPAQTAYASPEASMRHMRAAESLLATIDADAHYALAEALERVTGVRIGAAAGEVVSGRALIGDLSVLVLDLSERLGLDGSERPGGAATPEDLARELGVASKTLQRWRRNGLCAHWIHDGAKARVAIYRESLARFEARHPVEFARARAFRRFDADERRRLLDDGRRLLEKGLTANLAAKELAARFGRSHEGVRLLFLRELAGVRANRRGGGDRAARFAERAWRLGIEPSRIADRLGKSESFVRALVDRRRAEILRGVQPSWVELPTFDLPGADETIPSAPSVRALKPLGLRDGDFLETLASARELRRLYARETKATLERDETRAAAMHYLLRRASRAIDALPRWPDRAAIDRIETDLRTALRLRVLLVERGLMLALSRVDQSFDGRPERLPHDELVQLARTLGASVRGVVSDFDPARQRFDRAVLLAADFAVAKLRIEWRAGRAGVRHPEGVPFRSLGEVAQWQSLVDPFHGQDARLEAVIAGRGDAAARARLVARRHGLLGLAPRSIEELAEEDRTTVALMTRRVREAEIALRRG